ncbi:MAG: hypothetical protein AAGA66_17130 [Bacteroidota bacterium]
MKRLKLFLIILIPSFVYAQEWDKVQINATEVSDKIYYLPVSGGGNLRGLVGKEGVLPEALLPKNPLKAIHDPWSEELIDSELLAPTIYESL